MKNKLTLIIGGILSVSVLFSACDSRRTNTKREMDETYVEEGDTLDPTEGIGEGNKGHKFMETFEEDSLKNVEQAQ